MPNITVRNIPEELLNKLRMLSTMERRSLNNEILIILEKGLARESNRNSRKTASRPKDADIFIAATAATRCDMLITGNVKHFNRIAELRIENWLR